jgi:hypothetical protein
MNTTKILELLSYTIPTIVTGIIAYYFFKLHTKNENNRRNFLLRKEKQNVALPLRLQAYERMSLFLERLSPANLLVRVPPTGNDKPAYFKKLLTIVEKEFEHNLAQQIYVTDQCWNVIKTAKNSTINIIRDTMLEGEIKDARAMREAIIQRTAESEPPSNTALAFIKNEVHKIF